MKNQIKNYCYLFALLTLFTSCGEKVKLKSGMYRAELIMENNQQLTIPWLMQVEEKEDAYDITIINGEEEIKISDVALTEDSLNFKLPAFLTSIKSKVTETGLEGKWIDHNRVNYSLPFEATYDVTTRFEMTSEAEAEYIMGKYDVIFENEDQLGWTAIGQFTQNRQGLVRGTFITESGDYRHLSGIMDGDQLKLSTFDGAHAYLFTARKEGNDLVDGKFYSGNEMVATWKGFKVDDIELPDPYTKTIIKNPNAAFSFSFNDLNGNTISYPSDQFEDKVVIVQILGSWCPNCMDESNYLTQLYDEYHDDGLEIIGVAFEKSEDMKKVAKAINHFKNSLNIPYPIVYGGKANKEAASNAFPQLNEVSSFPTSIIIDREGNVRKIHTGFNGPGTGKVYEEYAKDMELYLSKLIHNKI